MLIHPNFKSERTIYMYWKLTVGKETSWDFKGYMDQAEDWRFLFVFYRNGASLNLEIRLKTTVEEEKGIIFSNSKKSHV